MLNFDENAVLQDHRNGLALIPQTQDIVDRLCARGYSGIFYLGIGGTVLYASQMLHIVRELQGTLPFHLENAADLCCEGNVFLDANSLVVVESISGDTKELVDALERVKAIGATAIGYVEKVDSPVAMLLDEKVVSKNCAYYFWYTVTLRLLHNAGQFPDYDALVSDMQALPEAIVQVYREADPQAEEYAASYCDEPITYLVGSGNLQDWATCYGMCIMEEMQWMKTRPVSAADFFHGTLEVIERDVPVILIKGEDRTRPQMERVENFVHKISAKVTVFDTKDFSLAGIRQEFRWILSPIVMRSAFQRVNAHLEHNRRHPLAIRRYYRRLDY